MSDINVTPLVDVMMVLLVIFIITAPLMVGSLSINLPQVDAAPAGAAPRVVRLAIDAQSRVYLDEQAIDDEALSRVLVQRAQSASAKTWPASTWPT